MASSAVILFAGATSGSGSSSIYVTSSGVGPGVITQVDPGALVLLPPLTSTGDGITGLVGDSSANISLLQLEALGDGLYGGMGDPPPAGFPEWPYIKLVSDGEGLWGGIAEDSQSIYLDSSGTGAWGGIASGTSLIGVSSVATSQPGSFIGSGESLIVLSSTGSGFIDGIIGSGTSRIYVDSYGTVNVTGLRDGESVWVVFPMNVPLAAVSHYSPQYNAYAVSSGKSYAIVNGVIRRLGERTDNATAIGSIIAKSAIDGGSSHRKIATDIFMRLMSEGNFTVNVSSDRGSGQITITDNLARKHGSKGDLPRGVIGREFAFNIKNVNGAYFEIDEIELIMALSDGRRGRQTNG